MRITQRKGDIATAFAIAVFTKYGWDVSVPLTESASYDLIVDVPNEGLKRVQVKYCTKPSVDLRNIHSNSKGYVVTRVKNGFDWLCVYHDNYVWLLKECPQQNWLTINERFAKL